MAIVQTLIGNIKGPQGATGPQGEQGVAGNAATITVGTTSTTAYGNPAQVTNVGSSSEAILNFVIPQGRTGESVTELDDLTLNTITTATAEYPQIAIGDTGSTIFGKIVKFFQDLVSKKVDTSAVVNNFTTTQAGYVADARTVNTLMDALSPYKSEGFSDSTSYGTVTGMRMRSGHTVYLSFEINLTAALSSGVLFTVPSGYRPIVATGSMLAFYKTTGAETNIYTRTFQVSTSGGVTQQISGSIPSGSKLTAFFTYRTSDAMP